MAFTPQLEVLEHCDYFITHAGTGSAMEALYYGVPCLCIPQMDEQMLTADRMVELKLASAALRKPQVTEETLKKALTELIDNPVYTKNAKRVSKEMNEEGGCDRAAQAVIDFMTGRK
jgi:MGT family glycosyltransferase